MTKDIDIQVRHVTKANGNVFADLGFAPEEATKLLAESRAEMARTDALKKQLMGEIAAWMNREGYKQLDAAKVLRVSRPRVSDVVNKKTEKFTLDSLIGMATLIGKKVRLIIE